MSRVLGVLGLARRAGALAIGTNSVLEAVRKGKAYLVLIASDASENTAKLRALLLERGGRVYLPF